MSLGVSTEMAEYTLSGCAPQFALWSFVDLGYLAYYVAYGIATEQIEAADGQRSSQAGWVSTPSRPILVAMPAFSAWTRSPCTTRATWRDDGLHPGFGRISNPSRLWSSMK